MRIEAAPHAKAHQSYYTADGKKVPGVTTVLGLLDKPFLKTWANNLGLEGYEVAAYTQAQARVGTLGHAMIEAELRGENPAVGDYAPNEVDRARNVLRSFQAWRRGHDLQPILLEESLVSEAHRYGGQIDLYASLDGKNGVIDFKSSNDIYDEQKTQVCTYAQLLEENGHDVEFAMLLRFPRSDDETFFTWQTTYYNARYDLFLCLLDVYNAQRGVLDRDENGVPIEKKTRKAQNSAVLVLGGGGSVNGSAEPLPVDMTTEKEEGVHA